MSWWPFTSDPKDAPVPFRCNHDGEVVVHGHNTRGHATCMQCGEEVDIYFWYKSTDRRIEKLEENQNALR